MTMSAKLAAIRDKVEAFRALWNSEFRELDPGFECADALLTMLDNATHPPERPPEVSAMTRAELVNSENHDVQPPGARPEDCLVCKALSPKARMGYHCGVEYAPEVPATGYSADLRGGPSVLDMVRRLEVENEELRAKLAESGYTGAILRWKAAIDREVAAETIAEERLAGLLKAELALRAAEARIKDLLASQDMPDATKTNRQAP